MRHISRTSPGFTIVEILVGMSIASVIMVGLFALITTIFESGSRSIESAKQVNEAQTTANMIRDDLRLTSRYLVTSSITDTSPSGSAWNFRGSNADNRVLILRTLATNLHKSNDGRTAVYRQSGGCPIGTDPVYNNVIYYLSSGTLYRRVVVEPPVSGIYCPGQTNGQIRTCTNPAAGGAPSNCAERDVVVAQNVTTFGILYYTRAGDQTESSTIFNTASNQGNLDALSTIKVTLSTSKQIGGEANVYTTNIRATRTASN